MIFLLIPAILIGMMLLWMLAKIARAVTLSFVCAAVGGIVGAAFGLSADGLAAMVLIGAIVGASTALKGRTKRRFVHVAQAMESRRLHLAPIVPSQLASRVRAATEAVDQAISVHPFALNILEWKPALARIPQIADQAQEVYRNASWLSRRRIRADLIQDMNAILSKAELVLKDLAQKELDVSRQWVRLRTQEGGV